MRKTSARAGKCYSGHPKTLNSSIVGVKFSATHTSAQSLPSIKQFGCRCFGHFRATRHGTESQRESLRIRKEIIDDLWNTEAEGTRDDHSFDHSTKASREYQKRIVLKLRVDRANIEDNTSTNEDETMFADKEAETILQVISSSDPQNSYLVTRGGRCLYSLH